MAESSKRNGLADVAEGKEDDVSSEYDDSDVERMALSSEDEEEVKYPVFNEATDMNNPKFEVSS